MKDLRILRGIAKAKLNLGCHDDFHGIGSAFDDAFDAQVAIDLIDEIESLRRKLWDPSCCHTELVHGCEDCEAFDKLTRHESDRERADRLAKELAELRTQEQLAPCMSYCRLKKRHSGLCEPMEGR